MKILDASKNTEVNFQMSVKNAKDFQMPVKNTEDFQMPVKELN